ncbi:hypothetical protein JAK50_16640 [Stenotrophomonas maltophilia]|nr:hypothetical protein [Stenotrophomonas maltophilia]
MEMAFCPLAADWGTVADYINGLVALGVGVAVYRLGTKTQATSDQVAKIEARARSREESVHTREGEGLLLYVYPDILLAERALEDVQNNLSGDIIRKAYMGDRNFRRRIADQVAGIDVKLLAEVIGRVHVLDDSAAGQALLLIGGLRGLKFTSNAAAEAQNDDPRLDGYLKTIVPTLDRLMDASKALQTRTHAVMTKLGLA